MQLERFRNYLKTEKRMAENSVAAYILDIEHFANYIKTKNVLDVDEARNSDVVSYLLDLKQEGKSKSTVNRKLASLRTYYSFLEKHGYIRFNPTNDIKSPKIEKKEIEFISIEDIDKLMSLPDDSLKGKRDRAILELLYATGIRATELIELKIDDVNIRMGFIKCQGEHSKARIIPLGRLARQAMEEYIFDVRSKLVKNEDNKSLFVNYMGEEFTRQGLWKVISEYGDLAQFEVKLTPQVIRNSFAVHMLQNGADLKSLQELMGHEDITATQAYLAVTKNRIKDVYDRTHPRA